MSKSYIGVDIIHHRLAGQPYVFRVSGERGPSGSASTGLDATRGILTAFVLSSVMWVSLIALLY